MPNQRNMVAGIVLLLAATLTLSCGAATTGRFADDAYHHTKQPMRLAYRDPAQKSLLGPAWYVENFKYSGDDGAEMPDKQKLTRGYLKTYLIDHDNSGTYRAFGPVPRNDLVLENRKHDGVIWMRSFPVDSRHDERDLLPTLRNYVDAAAGPTQTFSVRDATLVVDETRWATKLESLKRCTIAGREAASAQYIAANVDQLRIWPEARTRQVMLVLIDAGHRFEIPRTSRTLPSLLLLGYSNRPEEFAEGAKDFEALVSALQIGMGDPDEASEWQGGVKCTVTVPGVETESKSTPLEPTKPEPSPEEKTPGDPLAEDPSETSPDIASPDGNAE